MDILAQLIDGLDIQVVGGPVEQRIVGLTDDSRNVREGSLFIARRGTQADGLRFVASAIANGATAVLCYQRIEVPENVCLLLADQPSDVMPDLADRFFDNPCSKLNVIGVTGTNGKTTTAFMIRHLLNSAGRRCGLLGTIEIDDGASSEPAELTTPGLVELRDVFARMVRNGCDTAVMEVSSHALHQGRSKGIRFSSAIFTNLSGDHLDYHGTMDDYAAAKAILFEQLNTDATAIVNGDDAYSDRMLQDCQAVTLRFRIDGDAVADGESHAQVMQSTSKYTDCVFRGPWGEFRSKTPLVGRHNVANLLGAVSAAYAAGVGCDEIASAVRTCPPVPGRLQPVEVEGSTIPFSVLVDYAHTDDALANVLQVVRPLTQNRLRVLFGCGGDRDATKRPRMASVACRLADDIVITSDNPRTEDPDAIIEDIKAGVQVSEGKTVVVEPDRANAIKAIIDCAEAGDIVVLAGKGHEDYQILGKNKIHFDDREHARDALAARTQA